MHLLGMVTSEWASVTMEWAIMITRCPKMTTPWAIFTHAPVRDGDKCMSMCNNGMGNDDNRMPKDNNILGTTRTKGVALTEMVTSEWARVRMVWARITTGCSLLTTPWAQLVQKG